MVYVNRKLLNYSMFFDVEEAPYLKPMLDRRVAIITGANSGIGWYTALHLYLHGYAVYIFGRSNEKVLQAIDDIKDEAERRVNAYSDIERATRWLGELHFIYIDLLDLSTIKPAVFEFSIQEEYLHLFIGNAGVMGIPYSRTVDDFEVQHQTNYIGHFLLTMKLIPIMKRVSVRGKIQPRIVLLSSFGHKFVFKHFKPNVVLDNSPGYVFTWVRYGFSKIALIYLAKSLSKLHPDILSVSVHPGFVLNTELYTYWKELKYVGIFAKGIFLTGNSTIGVTNEEGSLATLRASLDPILRADVDGGKYFITGGQESTPTSEGSSDKAREEMWEWTVKELKERKFLFPDEISYHDTFHDTF